MESTGIRQKLRAFKKRYYIFLLLRGLILSALCVLTYFLVAVVAEYLLWMPSPVRFLLIALFIGICIISFYLFLRKPLLFYLLNKGMSDEEAARFIGKLFPNVRDKLLNLLQLANKPDSALAQASVQQRAREFQPIPFEKSIDLRGNRRYLRYLSVPLAALLLLLLLNASIITGSTYRIVHFQKPFVPEAPFDFVVENEKLFAFRNEDFHLRLSLTGNAIPDQVYLVTGSNRYKMQPASFGQFSYVFEKLQKPVDFHFEAAGFRSPPHHIALIERPELESLQVDLKFPSYLARKPEVLNNAGPLLIPEGTVVTWTARSNHADRAHIKLDNESQVEMQRVDNQLFMHSARLLHNGFYEIQLENRFSSNREQLRYPVEIIKDQYPELVITHLPDSIYYKRLLTGGIISDDHGLTELRLVFHMKKDGKQQPARAVRLPVDVGQVRQSFYYVWPLDTLHLKPGDELSYYLEVLDNDGVNGRKSTRSALYTIRLPDKQQVQSDIVRSQQQLLDDFRKGVHEAKDFKNNLEDAQQKIKGRQSLDWQDKKRLEELLEKRKSLDDLIRQLGEQNQHLENKKDAFTEQDERLRDKARQLQKLLDEMLDEETKKLLDELQKLLQENARTQDIQKILDQLNRDARNLEKELERTLELMKQMQFDYRLEQSIRDLKEIQKKQEDLLKETEKASQDKSGPDQTKDLARKQEELKSAFEEADNKLKEVEELGKEIGERINFPDDSSRQEVGKEMEKSRDNLDQGNPDGSKAPQKRAIEKVEEMTRQLEQGMEGAMIEMNMENLEALRHILHGLIKISYDQEQIITDFRKQSSNDPQFNALAQRQVKLKDDVKVLEDSLLALASRDPMMGSFISREITELEDHLKKAIESNKEKRRGPALSAMQLSMTSLNNLALMLDSHYDDMMKMLNNAKPSRSNKKNKGNNPRLSELQKQLNQKIEELKESGKQGRQLSEELARLAAEQERIRKALREFEEKLKKEGGKGPGEGLESLMEETEMDLVNKQLTEELIQRQRQILTRLLEAENSMREQDFDEERKGETARDYDKIMPKAIEDYLRKKEKETELLRTLPPRLYPYYQREIDEYLKRLRENNF